MLQKYGFWRAKTILLHCKNPLFALQEGGTTLLFVVVLLLFSPLIITYVHQFS